MPDLENLMDRPDAFSRQNFLAGLAAGAAALGSGGIAAAQSGGPPVRVALIPTDFAGQPYYAKDMGFFTKRNLNAEVVEMANGSVIASAIAGGSLDIGFSNIASLAIAHGKGFPFTYIAGANLYDSAGPTIGLLAVKRGSKITTAKDFSGKIIGVGGINNITHLGAKLWIDKNGGDSNAVKWIEIPIQTIVAMALNDRVDGAILDTAIYPSLLQPNDPLRLLASTFNAIAPKFLSGGWFTSRDWLAKHPGEAKAFVAAMTDAAEWGNNVKNHEASAGIIAKYLKQSAAAINASQRVTYATTLTPALIQPVIDLVARYKVIPSSFPASEIIA